MRVARALQKMPRPWRRLQRRQVVIPREPAARVLAQMESDRFQSNVKALHGAAWKGVFRRASATIGSSL